jgi:hypothetical protein
MAGFAKASTGKASATVRRPETSLGIASVAAGSIGVAEPILGAANGRVRLTAHPRQRRAAIDWSVITAGGDRRTACAIKARQAIAAVRSLGTCFACLATLVSAAAGSDDNNQKRDDKGQTHFRLLVVDV